MDLRYSESLTALRIIMRWRVDGGGQVVQKWMGVVQKVEGLRDTDQP